MIFWIKFKYKNERYLDVNPEDCQDIALWSVQIVTEQLNEFANDRLMPFFAYGAKYLLTGRKQRASVNAGTIEHASYSAKVQKWQVWCGIFY